MLCRRTPADILHLTSGTREAQVNQGSRTDRCVGTMCLKRLRSAESRASRELPVCTHAVAEHAAKALLALLAPAWGGLGSWGPTAVRRSLNAAAQASGRAAMLEAVDAWAGGGPAALHRLQLAHALADTGPAALRTVLSELPNAAARCFARNQVCAHCWPDAACR